MDMSLWCDGYVYMMWFDTIAKYVDKKLRGEKGYNEQEIEICLDQVSDDYLKFDQIIIIFILIQIITMT